MYLQSSYSDWLQGDYPDTFFFESVSVGEIQDLLLYIRNKICSVELVPISVYKYLSPIISPILCDLINKSAPSGTFPDSL